MATKATTKSSKATKTAKAAKTKTVAKSTKAPAKKKSRFIPGPVAVEKPEGRVLITGVSGGLGRLLTRKLHRSENVHGVDIRPMRGKPKDVTMHLLDYRKKKINDLFRAGDIKAVYHLGAVYGTSHSAETAHEFNLTGTSRLLELCDQYNVGKVVILSSSTVYGALPTNDQYIREEAPLLGGLRFPQIRALVEMDMLAQTFFWKHQHTDTVIIRPVHIVGPTVTNAFTRYLRMPRIPVLWGFDPLVQLIHEEDVVQALMLCLKKEGIKGVFNVAGPGNMPMSTIIKELDKPTFPVPHLAVSNLIESMFAAHLTSFRGPEVDYLRFICMVDDTRARDVLGYHPRYSLRETVRSCLYSVS